jgi:NADP-dependent 3-hydroxy acid dehydrogenase YdfG
MARPRYPLAGRTAVVTGAGSGIGRALALRFAAHGCPVAIADKDADGLGDTRERIGDAAFAQTVDVGDRQAMFAFAAQVTEWAPTPIGAVVNNAGVTVMQSFANAAVEDDEWVHGINFGGVVNGTHAFLPVLLRQNSGTLANVSSVFGLFGFPNQTAYCASKSAVRGFTEALRQEMRGNGVRIAVIHPGGIKTNIARNARFHADDAGSVDQADFARRFDEVARTTPERAAEIIHAGIEKGNPRIRIGADAVILDWIVRIAPVRYFDVVERVLNRMSSADNGTLQ